MDGFYVAKIQKLSNKRPEEEAEKATNSDGKPSDPDKVQDEHVESGSETEVPTQKKKRKGSKKRPGRQEREAEKLTKKGKPDRVSVPPPSQQQSKKRKLSAKVTKPRRVKL
jgi:hypothetical protein